LKKRKDENSKSPRKKSLSSSHIKRGISSSELKSFTRDELIKLCRSHDIPYAGSKEQIAKRILLYFDSASDDDKSKEKSYTKKK